jgi:hypothetical protein
LAGFGVKFVPVRSNSGNALELLYQTYAPKKPDIYNKGDSNLAHLFCFGKHSPLLAGFAACSPPKPDPVLFIMKKAPHFIHYHGIGACPNACATTRAPVPSAARLIAAFFTSGLRLLQRYSA